MDASQFREYVVEPVVRSLGLPDPKRRIELLMMTAAHESAQGRYIKQIRGPALGLFQMEPATHSYIYSWLCNHQPADRRRAALEWALERVGSAEQMTGNHYYATAIAAFNYYSKPGRLPNNIADMTDYAKKYWNTHLGKATPGDYLDAYIAWGYRAKDWNFGLLIED